MASFTLETAQSGQARAFEFDAPHVSIGRDRSADFTLDHPTVSRQHAVVAWDGRGYKLVILSRGGLTAIDGQQVGGEVPLYDGCQLMIGQLAFIFRSAAASPRPAHNPYGAGQSGAQQPVYHDPQFPVASTTGMFASPTGLYQQQTRTPSTDATTDFQSLTRPTSGAFPSMAEHEKLAQSRAAASSDGLLSWEEIAATADQMPEKKDALTDFHRMQKAQEVADQQARGVNPMVMIGVILAVGFVALIFVYGDPGQIIAPPPDEVVEDPCESLDPTITWRKAELDCIGAAQCREAAINAYEVGKVMIERQEADIINLYDGYKQLDRSERLLVKANIDPPPPELDRLAALKKGAAEDMRALFLRERANYLAQEDYKDYKKMVGYLDRIHAYFPDERLNYHCWAQRRINSMKEDNVYPK